MGLGRPLIEEVPTKQRCGVVYFLHDALTQCRISLGRLFRHPFRIWEKNTAVTMSGLFQCCAVGLTATSDDALWMGLGRPFIEEVPTKRRRGLVYFSDRKRVV